MRTFRLKHTVLLLASLAAFAPAIHAFFIALNTVDNSFSTSHVVSNADSSSSSYLANPTNSYPYPIKLDRLAGVGPMSDMADCNRCVAGWANPYFIKDKGEPGLGQYLRSCYRCKTSPHPWTNQQSVDLFVANSCFIHHGIPTSVTGRPPEITERCSVAKCEAWIANNPVLGPRKAGLDASTAGLQACYACQHTIKAWPQTEDGQRVYAKLANLMFGTVLAPSKQLAAAAAAGSREGAAWEMAASRLPQRHVTHVITTCMRSCGCVLGF